MKTYIALLRGINVTGHNKIKMADLKELFIEEGFCNVSTYIQSGNVIFETHELSLKIMERQIIAAILSKFGYSIKVMVFTKNHLNTVFSSNPFIHRKNIDIAKLHVTLLGIEPDFKAGKLLEDSILTNEDEFKIINNVVYIYCPNGYGRTKLTNNLFENKLKTSATTRNWKTITKLIELSNQQIE